MNFWHSEKGRSVEFLMKTELKLYSFAAAAKRTCLKMPEAAKITPWLQMRRDHYLGAESVVFACKAHRPPYTIHPKLEHESRNPTHTSPNPSQSTCKHGELATPQHQSWSTNLSKHTENPHRSPPGLKARPVLCHNLPAAQG